MKRIFTKPFLQKILLSLIVVLFTMINATAQEPVITTNISSGGSYKGTATSGTSYVGVGSVGSNGVIYTSPDFTTNWTDKSPANINELNAVVYTGSKYVAVGNQTVLESSDNGNTWSSIATPPDNFFTLSYGASKLVAGGYDANTAVPRIAYSTDGTSWTTANTADNYYFKIKFVNGAFFAVGLDNKTLEGVIMYSTNGTSWTNITPTLPFPVFYFNDVVYDGSKFHFMGMGYVDLVNYELSNFFSVSTATVTNPASYTDKGKIVTAPSGVNLGGNWGQGAFAYSNGRFVGSVNDIVTGQTYIIYSSNGVSWNAVALSETTSIYGITSSGNKFRLMGSGDGKILVEFNLVTLPVQFTAFTASLVNAQSLLQWQTATEENSSLFNIEHSSDGMNWKNIGTVAAAGNSQSLRSYLFTHSSPANGYNYYRIAEVDMNNKQQLSPVKLVKTGSSMGIRLFPNPANGWAILDLPGTKPATVIMYNAAGRMVYHQYHTEKLIRLSLEAMPAGVYKLAVTQDGNHYVQQLVRQ